MTTRSRWCSQSFASADPGSLASVTQDQPPGTVPEDPPADDAVDAPEEPKEWWDDPRLPWKHKPTRADLACYTWIAILGVYGIVMLPLRPVCWCTCRYGAAQRRSYQRGATGALLHVEGGPIVLYWLGVTLSILKFDWVYWWAGKLWGPAILETFTGRSKLSQRRAELVLKFTHKYETLAVIATYLPLPLPMALIYAAVGASGMRLRKFLVIDIITAMVFQALYLALGWWIGEPAVRIVKIYADFAWYVTIAILVGMLLTWWWRCNREDAA